MSKILSLYNTFTRTFKHVELSGNLVCATSQFKPIHGSMYICGPTVYADSHIGHALTYIRADLFKRVLKRYFNVNLATVMNITDIDDKIINEVNKRSKPGESLSSDPSNHPFRQVSEQYLKSFQDDMKKIRVQPPDLTLKISDHIDVIMAFIRQLEEAGCAYSTPEGDVFFDVTSIPNYIGRVDPRSSKLDIGYKRDQRDFALWKAAKPGEPIWIYKGDNGREVPGRPGWHVQCSALATSVFGNQLDFHFGGKDLIFPHHYNEEACCCAFHKLDTSHSLHVWAKYWLHSSHILYGDSKMSKSIGNVMSIKNFIDRASVNALRFLCIIHHYRTDLVFSNSVLESVKALDHRLSAFISSLDAQMKLAEQRGNLPSDAKSDLRLSKQPSDIDNAIEETYEEILDGICDDFDLHRGLNSIQDLIGRAHSIGLDNLSVKDLVSLWSLLKDWCGACGLEYGPTDAAHDRSLVELLRDFRQQVREWALGELRETHKSTAISRNKIQKLLEQCDNVRKSADELGFVLNDTKSTKDKKQL